MVVAVLILNVVVPVVLVVLWSSWSSYLQGVHCAKSVTVWDVGWHISKGNLWVCTGYVPKHWAAGLSPGLPLAKRCLTWGGTLLGHGLLGLQDIVLLMI